MEHEVKDKRTRLERFAESQNLVFFGLAIMLVPFMIHTATLLLNVSVVKWEWYAYFFAFGFDLAIFIFAAHGRRTAAGGIAFIVFLMNVSVLNLDTMNQRFDPLWVKFLITAVLSGTGAWILHSYVVMFNEKKEERDNSAQFYETKFNLEKQIGDLTLEKQGLLKQVEDNKTLQLNLKHSQNQNAELSALVSELKLKVSTYTEQLKDLEIEKRVAEKTAESQARSENLLKDVKDYVELSDGVMCKKCDGRFENEAKLKAYQTRGLCNFEGCGGKASTILAKVAAEAVTV